MLAKSLGIGSFSAVPIIENINEGFICEGDCSKCQTCYEKNNVNKIYVEIHGGRVKKFNKKNNGTCRIENSSKNYRDNKNKTVRN